MGLLRRILPAVLMVVATGCSSKSTINPIEAWQWETSPWIRRLKHWNEPVVAHVGDMPIFQSDVMKVYKGLPPPALEMIKQDKEGKALVNMTIDEFLLRQAALDRGALQSDMVVARLNSVQSQVLDGWLFSQIPEMKHTFTDAEIHAFIAHNPNLFAARRLITYRAEMYPAPPAGAHGAAARPDLHVPVKSQRASGVYFVKGQNASLMETLSRLAPGKSTAFLPCGPKNVCRYVKEKDIPAPPPDPKQTREIAQAELTRQARSAWVKQYRQSQAITIDQSVAAPPTTN